MAISMYLAVELKDALSKSYGKQALLSNFLPFDAYFQDQSPEVVSRFLGQSILRNRLVSGAWRAFEEPTVGWPPELKSASLVMLKGLNSVLTLSLEFDEAEYAQVASYRKLSSVRLRKLLELFQVESFLQTDRSVYATVGTIAPIGNPWEPLTSDGWVHIQGDYIQGRLLEQLVTRVGIERALLGWAAWKGEGSRLPLLMPPISLAKIRKWPVELLTDRTEISQRYLALRESLNLPRSRAELMEAGKSWWSSASTVGASVAALAAVLGLWLRG